MVGNIETSPSNPSRQNGERSAGARSSAEGGVAAGGAHGPIPGATPKRWWQWLLVYPALGISLVTAAPKWTDGVLAAYHNVQNRSYSEAKLQADRWAKNLPCTAFPLNYNSTEAGVRLDATICNSGDIFVRASTPDNKSHFYWVPVERVVGKEVREPSLLSGAQAAEAPSGGARISGAVTRENDSRANLFMRVQFAVLCQRFIDQRHVVRRISTPQGCFDQVVDTYTGQVVSMQSAPCAC